MFVFWNWCVSHWFSFLLVGAIGIALWKVYADRKKLMIEDEL